MRYKEVIRDGEWEGSFIEHVSEVQVWWNNNGREVGIFIFKGVVLVLGNFIQEFIHIELQGVFKEVGIREAYRVGI